jgi:hypothetical protein
VSGGKPVNKKEEDETMKKIYKVNVEKCDANEGKTTWTENEYIATENIAAYIEAKKTAIENTPYWWMDHRKDYTTGRPLVTAEAIAVREV